MRERFIRSRHGQISGQNHRSPLSGPLMPGTVLINFALPGLVTGTETLSAWRGRQLLLVFWHPRSSRCLELLPRLADAHGPACRELPILLISGGDRQEARNLLAVYGIERPAAWEEHDEIRWLYRVPGVPSGFVVDNRGTTVGEMLQGVEALCEAKCGRLKSTFSPARTVDIMPPRFVPERSSGGLMPGTRVPSGGLTLDDGRTIDPLAQGRVRTLLVFADGDGDEWQRLAPILNEVQNSDRGVQPLVVARGEQVALKRRAAEAGLLVPIVAQRGREIARRYATLGTPSAYAIGEGGIVTFPLAEGTDAIVTLILQYLGGGGECTTLSLPAGVMAVAESHIGSQETEMGR